jgi:bifunctional polynucleotide phosphatase/kinase
MSFQEILTNSGHILLWEPQNNEQINSNKILGMDLDWTLIKPIKGKIHPIDENDWEFLYKDLSIIKKKMDEGYKLVIFTNQGGLINQKTGRLGLNGFKNRWLHILEKLKNYNIQSVYLLASLYDDFNRKPAPGMWDYLEKHLNNNVKIARESSLYIGDMAGRKADYAPTDLLFALNLGVEFQVPEVFYENSTDIKNKSSRLIKSILEDDKIFNGKKFIETFSSKISKINNATTQEIKANLEDKHIQSMVIFVGSPASGKTSFYKMYLSKITNTEYLNMDSFKGTASKFNKEVENILNKGKNLIIDNTNSKIKTRQKYTNIARTVNEKIKIFTIHFNTQKSICLHLNALRTKIVNVCVLNNRDNCGANVPAVAIHTYWKNLEIPDIEKEDFDILYTIQYEPIFMKCDRYENICKDDFNLLL